MSRETRFSCVLGIALVMLSVGIGGAAQKRHHEAHVHGVAEINIAVEGTKAVIEFRAPAESVMGFEHEAQSASERKKRDAALELLRAKRNEIVLFDSKLGCKTSEMKTKLVEEQNAGVKEQPSKDGHGHKDHKKSAEHREVHGTFTVACDKPLAGSRVRFGAYKVFRNIEEIKVQVVSDSGQSGTTIKKDKGDVRL